MAGEWREVRLGEVVELQRETLSPDEFPDQLFCYYSIPAYEARQSPTLERGCNIGSTKFVVRDEVILLSKLNPHFPRVWHVKHEGRLPAVASTEFLVLRTRSAVDPRFVKYLCLSPHFLSALQAQASGTSGSHQRVQPRDVLAMRVCLPPLPEQRAIAHILGTLDDKIELNRRMSETPESVARALFKAWFVDFEPVRAKMEGRWRRGQSLPGLPAHLYGLFPDRLVDSELGEIPEGWEVKALDEIAHFVNGLALQKYPPADGRSLPVIKIAQLRSGNTTGADKASADLEPDYVVNDGDILFSWSGSLECVVWSGGQGALNQHIFKVTSERYPRWLCYFGVHAHLDEFRHVAAGKATTMGHIQRHHLSEAKLPVPPPPLLDMMDRYISPIFECAWKQRIESRTLAALRDALLPKLISGELRVKDAERFLKTRGL